MRGATQEIALSRQGFEVEKSQYPTPDAKKRLENSGVSGVSGVAGFSITPLPKHEFRESRFSILLFFTKLTFLTSTPDIPDTGLKTRSFSRVRGCKNCKCNLEPLTHWQGEKVDRTGFSVEVAEGFREAGNGSASAIAIFVCGLLTSFQPFVPSSTQPTTRALTMEKQERNVGRPALSDEEKLVPTTIRLLPSVRKAIELKAQSENKSIGSYLRDLAEQHLQEMMAA